MTYAITWHSDPQCRTPENTSGRPQVLFVVPSLARAGAETQLVDLVNGIASALPRPALFAFEPCMDQLGRVDRNYVDFFHLRRGHKFDTKIIKGLAALIDQRKIDIIHCTLQFSLVVAFLATMIARRKPKIVLVLHTTQRASKREEFFDAVLYRWLMKTCASVICVCREQENHWLTKFPYLRGRTRVIHNGIDTQHYCNESFKASVAEWRLRNGIPKNAVVLCQVAAFRPEKGHVFMLEVFTALHDAGIHPYLVFVGDGVTRRVVQNKVETSGLRKFVRFVGSVSDVRPVLTSSDIAVIPSQRETFSMAMLEAMALELPVVATDVGGAREAIKNGENGLLTHPNDRQGFVDALKHLIERPLERRRLGSAARAHVDENFTRVSMISNTNTLFCDLTSH